MQNFSHCIESVLDSHSKSFVWWEHSRQATFYDWPVPCVCSCYDGAWLRAYLRDRAVLVRLHQRSAALRQDRRDVPTVLRAALLPVPLRLRDESRQIRAHSGRQPEGTYTTLTRGDNLGCVPYICMKGVDVDSRLILRIRKILKRYENIAFAIALTKWEHIFRKVVWSVWISRCVLLVKQVSCIRSAVLFRLLSIIALILSDNSINLMLYNCGWLKSRWPWIFDR